MLRVNGTKEQHNTNTSHKFTQCRTLHRLERTLTLAAQVATPDAGDNSKTDVSGRFYGARLYDRVFRQRTKRMDLLGLRLNSAKTVPM